MTINTLIPKNQWLDFLATFSNGNRGRLLGIEVFDNETGSSGQARQGKLMAVDYDPAGKGNDIIVTTGTDEIDYSHTIHQPAELRKAQLDAGDVMALEIVDQQGVKTVLSLS